MARHHLFGLVGVALFALLASLAAAAEMSVETAVVPEMKAVFGQVRSRTVVPARARTGGTIQTISVTEGSEVSEGEVVARIVDEKITLEIEASKARLMELRSQRDNARIELDRAEQLVARGVAPQGRLDQAKTQFDVAVNQVAAAEAAKAVLEQRLREGDVLAPTSGRVLSVPVTPGSVVLPGEAVARIATGQYFLRLSLPERHAAEIREGGTVLLGRRGLGGATPTGAEQQGRIAKVYPEISDGRVIADVEVGGLGDYFVNERTLVWIPVGSRRAVTVPPQAVTTRHGIDYVTLIDAGATLEVAVILGQTFLGESGPRVEILSGLRDGDRVLVP